jgi:hypothetical protein
MRSTLNYVAGLIRRHRKKIASAVVRVAAGRPVHKSACELRSGDALKADRLGSMRVN